MHTLAAAALIAATIQPGPSAPPVGEGTRVVVQWDTFGFAPANLGDPAVAGAKVEGGAPPTISAAAIVNSGGFMGGGAKAKSACHGWAAVGTALARVVLPAESSARLNASKDLPAEWFTLAPMNAGKEPAGAVLTVDLNAARLYSEGLFDSPWLQRVLDRLALDNARLVSLRAMLAAAPVEKLPPLLELRAVASARSVAPGASVRPVTLVSSSWGGTDVDAAAVEGANWAASLRADSGGLGRIGRDGGVGTWAGLIRLGVDLAGTVNNADTGSWATEYAAWQDRAADSLRSLSMRLQPRGTLGCYGTTAAPSLVLAVPARKGESVDSLTKAVEQLAGASGLDGKSGVWTVKGSGQLTPKLAVTVCETGGGGAYLVAAVEGDDAHSLLLQTAARLRNTK